MDTHGVGSLHATTAAAGHEAISVGVAPAAMTVVVLGRELDAAAAARFDDALAPIGARRHVVLDLTDVTFADASGLAFVVRARRRLAGRGGDLNLIGASADIERLLAACGLSGPLAWAERAAAVRWEPLSPPSGSVATAEPGPGP
jgi:anti-anti-sigma factor